MEIAAAALAVCLWGCSDSEESRPPGPAPTSPVVFNEISALTQDWIELGNSGSEAEDLSGHGVCDSDANGGCNVAEALRFPDGTTLAPGERLFIVCDQLQDAGAGPHMDCLLGGPSSCFYVTWKVSSSSGETVFLISPNDTVVGTLHYPQNAVPAGQTWGRLPDLTGTPGPNAPTPGAPNAPP